MPEMSIRAGRYHGPGRGCATETHPHSLPQIPIPPPPHLHFSSHRPLLSLPATTDRQTGRHCLCRGAESPRRAASIIRGDHRSFNILVLIPSGALWLCLKYHGFRWGFAPRYRGSCHFSAGILNTIEKVRSRIAKVTCFTVKIAVPAGPPQKWQHYRGFEHLGRWGS